MSNRSASANDLSLLPSSHAQAVAGPLAVAAIDALRSAATQRTQQNVVVEERSIWLPDSWLIQRCWEELADAGYVGEAMAAARLAGERHALAPIQTIQRLSKVATTQPELRTPILGYLRGLVNSLTASHPSSPITQNAEGLLAAAVAATHLNEPQLSLVFLERLDQIPKGWEQLISKPETRQTLALVVARQPLHPLIAALLSGALRRFGDAGAMFLHDIAQQIDFHDSPPHQKALLLRCVDVFRFGMLATPQSQRLAIATYGKAGLAREALQQTETLTNILEARRLSALDRQIDQNIVRQVKRPAANADADFQVYALTEAIHNMHVHALEREQRIALATRLALISRRSDGWTSASAAQTLVELGALKFATEAIERIAPTDPTRVEAVISLVRALLEVGEYEIATEQVEKSLLWADTTTQGQLRKQALIRGLGEVYLAQNQPLVCWQLLERSQPQPTFLDRIQSWFGERWNDDTLRNEALRLRALLHPEGIRLSSDPRAISALVARLQSWSKQLLDGEALANFTIDALLRPLLEAGLVSQVWQLLPELEGTLVSTSGDKHANRVHTVCTLLAEQTLPMTPGAEAGNADARLSQFLQGVWRADAQRSVWQTVHGIEGSLPLLIALDGAESVLAIAQVAYSIIGSAEDEVIDGGE